MTHPSEEQVERVAADDPEPCGYCGALPCDQASHVVMGADEWRQRAIEFAVQYGPRCRDCADEDGICPATGLPCGEARKPIGHVVNAIMHGVHYGYLTPPPVLAAHLQSKDKHSDQ